MWKGTEVALLLFFLMILFFMPLASAYVAPAPRTYCQVYCQGLGESCSGGFSDYNCGGASLDCWSYANSCMCMTFDYNGLSFYCENIPTPSCGSTCGSNSICIGACTDSGCSNLLPCYSATDYCLCYSTSSTGMILWMKDPNGNLVVNEAAMGSCVTSDITTCFYNYYSCNIEGFYTGMVCYNDACSSWTNLWYCNLCGNGVCQNGETQNNCCKDCGCPVGNTCINNVCTAPAVCGNGVCQNGETQNNCCKDCGCPVGNTCINNVCTVIPVCGNIICESGENQTNCQSDCNTKVIISPSRLYAGEKLNVAVYFNDSGYASGENAKIVLYIDNVPWTNCAVHDSKWKDDLNWNGNTSWIANNVVKGGMGTASSLVSITSLNSYARIEFDCTVPVDLSQGVHTLKAVPYIYSKEIELRSNEANFTVSDNSLMLVKFILFSIKLIF